MTTSQIITAVITAAAEKHVAPVDPLSLVDITQFWRDGYLRARLNALVAHRLHHHHKLTYVTIARAYRTNANTIRMRCYQGIRLHHKNPWKQTYLSLP